jgi:hypothetical protein
MEMAKGWEQVWYDECVPDEKENVSFFCAGRKPLETSVRLNFSIVHFYLYSLRARTRPPNDPSIRLPVYENVCDGQTVRS